MAWWGEGGGTAVVWNEGKRSWMWEGCLLIYSTTRRKRTGVYCSRLVKKNRVYACVCSGGAKGRSERGHTGSYDVSGR